MQEESTSSSLAMIPPTLIPPTVLPEAPPLLSDSPHPKLKRLGGPLASTSTSTKKKRVGGGDPGPRLLVKNPNFEDVEFFNPYTREVETRVNHRLNDRILASNQNWLLMASAENDIYFLHLLTSVVIQLPVLVDNQQYNNLAGVFALSTLHTISVIVLIFEYSSNGQILLQIRQNMQWRQQIFAYRDHGVNSLILHDGRIWWISNESKLFILPQEGGQSLIMQVFTLPSSAYSLVSLNQDLYLVDFITSRSFQNYLQCYVISNQNPGVLNFQPVRNIGRYDMFVVPTQAGLSLPAPRNSTGGRIFIGIQSTVDCSMFNVLSGVSTALKVCRDAVLHAHCKGVWLSG